MYISCLSCAAILAELVRAKASIAEGQKFECQAESNQRFDQIDTCHYFAWRSALLGLAQFQDNVTKWELGIGASSLFS